MNKEAFDKTLETELPTTEQKQKKLWMKGETSGTFSVLNSLKLTAITIQSYLE